MGELIQAVWNGAVLAESADTVVIEGNHYFPADALNAQYVTDSTTTSVCPWKGTARYYSITVDGKTNPDAAWYYPDPSAKAAAIKGRVAFWKGVQIGADAR